MSKLTAPQPKEGDAETLDVAILVPCLNEELGIASVIADFRAAIPGCRIVVVDNNSTDETVEVARAAGADLVLSESRPGKAMAVLTGLDALSTDVIIMVDGDGSYLAEGGRILLDEYRRAPADMLTGIRVDGSGKALKPLHKLGQRAFERALEMVFGHRPMDLFSGLRLFSRRFAENVPILSRGFELEIELTIQAIDKGFRVRDVPTPFRERAKGSFSKLRTFRDGFRILRFLLVLFRDYRPLRFFGVVAVLFALASLLAGAGPIADFWMTGLVARFPRAILAASLGVISFFSMQTGFILESSLRASREAVQIRMRQSGGRGRSAAPRAADRSDR